MGQKDGNSLISYIISGLNLVSNWLHSGLDASTISLRFSDSILFKPSSRPHHTPSYCKPLFIPSSSSPHFPKISFLCILWTNPYSPVEPCFKCPILCKAFLILIYSYLFLSSSNPQHFAIHVLEHHHLVLWFFNIPFFPIRLWPPSTSGTFFELSWPVILTWVDEGHMNK